MIHDFDPAIAFTPFGPVYWYGAVYSIGFIGIFVWFWMRRKSLGFTNADVFTFAVLFAVGVMIGGRVSLGVGIIATTVSLLIGVAYGATIGGMATLVGTAPNAILVGFMQETYGTEIDFASWMLVGLPLSILMLPVAWIVLTRFAFKVDFKTSAEGKAELARMKEELGPMSTPEKRVAAVFLVMAATWILRPLLVKIPGLAALDDSAIAIAGAITLFVIPSGNKEDPLLLRWKYAEQLPFGVLLLFGGGMSLARRVADTGLAEWIGSSLDVVSSLPLPVIVIIAATMIIFLTELTSNIGTTTTFLPVVGAVAIQAGVDPIVVTVPVTFAASCAFMLPVATPPNAIVFGSGMLTIPKMVRAGMMLNIVSIFIVSLVALYLAPKFL